MERSESRIWPQRLPHGEERAKRASRTMGNTAKRWPSPWPPSSFETPVFAARRQAPQDEGGAKSCTAATNSRRGGRGKTMGQYRRAQDRGESVEFVLAERDVRRIGIADGNADEIERRLHHRRQSAMHPLRREKGELKLQLGGARVILDHEGVDDVPRDLRSGRRHGGTGAAELERREQHLHGGEVARMAGAVDLDDQPRHARKIARAFLDELHA